MDAVPVVRRRRRTGDACGRTSPVNNSHLDSEGFRLNFPQLITLSSSFPWSRLSRCGTMFPERCLFYFLALCFVCADDDCARRPFSSSISRLPSCLCRSPSASASPIAPSILAPTPPALAVTYLGPQNVRPAARAVVWYSIYRQPHTF